MIRRCGDGFLSLFRNSNQLSFRERHTFEMKGGMGGRGDDGKEGQVKERRGTYIVKNL